MNSKWNFNFCKGFLRFLTFSRFLHFTFYLIKGKRKENRYNCRKEACTGIVIYDGDESIKKAL